MNDAVQEELFRPLERRKIQLARGEKGLEQLGELLERMMVDGRKEAEGGSVQTFRLDDRMPWGKHKGEELVDVIISDVEYVAWLVRETGFLMTNEAYNFYKRRAEEEGVEP